MDSATGPALRVLRQILTKADRIQAGDWDELIQDIAQEGVLPYIAFQLIQRDEAMPSRVYQALKKELLLGEAEKLSDDLELELIFASAQEKNLSGLVIKGEALARSLYPTAACRPTGDYDLLIRPRDLAAFQLLLSDLGYQGGKYAGKHILAEQTWICQAEVRGRTYQVDLHWDIANQRFFRRRLPLPALWADAQSISLASGQIATPSHPHALLIACVHLAAATPGHRLQLKWLLDIHLLLDGLISPHWDRLVGQARTWKLLDVLVFFCLLARKTLGGSRHAEHIAALAAKRKRLRGGLYRWTLDHRWFDLLEYAIRLPGFTERQAFISQIFAYRKSRQENKRM